MATQKPNMSDLKERMKSKQQLLERSDEEERLKREFIDGAQYVPNKLKIIKVSKTFSIPQELDTDLDELATILPKTTRSDVIQASVALLKSLDSDEIRKKLLSIRLN